MDFAALLVCNWNFAIIISKRWKKETEERAIEEGRERIKEKSICVWGERERERKRS